MADAGYPDGFPYGMAVFEVGNSVNLVNVTEIVVAMAAGVGFQPEFFETEFSQIRPAMANKTLDLMFGLPLSNRPITESVGIFNYSETQGLDSGAERVDIAALYEKANQQFNFEERYFVEMEIAAYKYYEYLELPLLWLPATALVNADTVANYTFPGTGPGVFSHLEYVEPLR